MEDMGTYPMIPHTDTQLRIEALVQARHAAAGKTPEEIKDAAAVFFGFLKGSAVTEPLTLSMRSC